MIIVIMLTFIIMAVMASAELNVVMLGVIILSVVMPISLSL